MINLLFPTECPILSLAYQGYGRGVDKELIKNVNITTTKGRNPNKTIYIRINPIVAMERIRKRRKEIDYSFEQIDFLTKVSNGYEEIFGKQSDVIIVDGNMF